MLLLRLRDQVRSGGAAGCFRWDQEKPEVNSKQGIELGTPITPLTSRAVMVGVYSAMLRALR